MTESNNKPTDLTPTSTPLTSIDESPGLKNLETSQDPTDLKDANTANDKAVQQIRSRMISLLDKSINVLHKGLDGLEVSQTQAYIATKVYRSAPTLNEIPSSQSVHLHLNVPRAKHKIASAPKEHQLIEAQPQKSQK